MAKPPLNPITQSNGREVGYFEKLVAYAKYYLEEDGIKLTFEGYKDTLMEYANLHQDDTSKAWNLAKDLNGWSEYFSSLANLIQKLYLDSETSKKEALAVSSVENDATKVANGDRLANKDPNVVNARKKRNTMKAFYDELTAKVEFLERAHYHCKATCELAKKQLSN